MISLSWSRLSDYNQCPRKFRLKYIDKVFKEEEKSIHLQKGAELHKQLEDYVLARLGHGQMPIGFAPQVQQTIPIIDGFFASGYQVYPEAQVSAGRNWQPLEWFDKSTMYRAIWDVIAIKDTVFIGDYKSGKVYDYGKDYGQLHLSGAIALHRFPDKPAVDVAYLYIEHKHTVSFRIYRDEAYRRKPEDVHLSMVQTHFENEFEKVQKDTEFKPTPNEFCKWCPANKTQCQFSRKL